MGSFVYDGSWEHFERVKNALSTGEQTVEPWLVPRPDEDFDTYTKRFLADGMNPPIAARIIRLDGTSNLVNPGTTVSIDGA